LTSFENSIHIQSLVVNSARSFVAHSVPQLDERMKSTLLTVLLLFCTTYAFSNELIGDWVEVETGLGMSIKEKGIIILNSRGEHPISGTWSSEKNKLKVSYTEKGKERSGKIPYLFRDGSLVFPSQHPGSREEVYKRVTSEKMVEQ
jgi:hypothetical protein